MKYSTTLAIIMTIICLFLISLPVSASNKTIYIKPFGIETGLSETDPIGTRIQNYISEDILDMGGYSITSDDEVREVLKQEELKMSLNSCSDDSCIKQLMESIRTDYIIYGTVSYEDGVYHITAKMLDRTDGTVKLARVKTLIFKDKNKIRSACTDLARYLIDGDAINMNHYDDTSSEYSTPVKILYGIAPGGLSISFVYLTPLKAPFEDYYDTLLGGEIGYCHILNDYFAISGGVYYVMGDDKSGVTTLSLNSYSAGIRLGFPLLDFFYPYIEISGRITWYNEKHSSQRADFMGYGGDGRGGCAIVFGSNFSIWADYSMSIVKLNDDAATNISGSVIRCGLMLAF